MSLSIKVKNLFLDLIFTHSDFLGQTDSITRKTGWHPILWKIRQGVEASSDAELEFEMFLEHLPADMVEVEFKFLKNKTSTASWRLERDGRLLKGATITWAVCAGNGGFAVYPSEGDQGLHLSSLVCKRIVSDSGNSWAFSVS